VPGPRSCRVRHRPPPDRAGAAVSVTSPHRRRWPAAQGARGAPRSGGTCPTAPSPRAPPHPATATVGGEQVGLRHGPERCEEPVERTLERIPRHVGWIVEVLSMDALVERGRGVGRVRAVVRLASRTKALDDEHRVVVPPGQVRQQVLAGPAVHGRVTQAVVADTAHELRQLALGGRDRVKQLVLVHVPRVVWPVPRSAVVPAGRSPPP